MLLHYYWFKASNVMSYNAASQKHILQRTLLYHVGMILTRERFHFKTPIMHVNYNLASPGFYRLDNYTISHSNLFYLAFLTVNSQQSTQACICLKSYQHTFAEVPHVHTGCPSKLFTLLFLQFLGYHGTQSNTFVHYVVAQLILNSKMSFN